MSDIKLKKIEDDIAINKEDGIIWCPANMLDEKIETLEGDIELLKNLCMEFASLGRCAVNQNKSLTLLCGQYSEFANKRHLTTNKEK
ncbi:MAG: hypothetical protein IID54_03455 [Proteobacteria bacterium]|nr:hypothetical protein [Pseudomonadota bacterium]